MNYLAFSQEIKIHWLHEPVTSSMITIAVVDGWAGRACNYTSSSCSHREKALIINGDARQGWNHLVEDGRRGKALSYTLNHSTFSYTSVSEPRVPVQYH